jgi:hypothetical protein
MEVKSTTFLPVSMFPPIITFRDSSLNLLPLQSSHTSSEAKYFVPRPLQVGHAPYGRIE